MTDKTPSSEYGEYLADAYTGLMHIWREYGPEAVWAQLENMEPHTVKALLMIRLGASVS